MDQETTSAMPSNVPGEKEGEQPVSQETILELGGINKTDGEGSSTETNRSSCGLEINTTPVSTAESEESTKNDDAPDNQQLSNTANDCEEAKVAVSPAIKEEPEENITKVENSLLDTKEDTKEEEERNFEDETENHELPVQAEVPNATQETNGAGVEFAEVSEPKSCNNETTEDTDGTETKKLEHSSPDSVDDGLEQKNTAKDEKNAEPVPIVVVTEEISKESISEAAKNETTESPTETIEFSLIEITEEAAEETTTANVTAVEIIVESNSDADSVAIVTENVEDKNASITETSIIANKNEPRVSVDEENASEAKSAEKSRAKKSDEEETTDSEESIRPEVSKAEKMPPTSSKVTSENSQESEKPVTAVSSPSAPRSVIQDIFDDWRDENPEDECQQTSKSHDSVEMELQILLDDDKPDRNCNENAKKTDDPATKETDDKNSVAKAKAAQLESTESKESEKRRESSREASSEQTAQQQQTGSRKSDKPVEAGVKDRRQKPLAPRPGVKVPGFLLSSPIVSKTAVSKVLKERLREQQKEFDAPVKPDIFFVKKITQRLSHKLAAASAAQLPGLVPIPHGAGKTEAGKIPTTKSPATSDEKRTSSVDKELLAILEGDVDPDWSNLRPPNLAEEKNGPAAATTTTTTELTPPKLDPVIERELALKQLLELPSSPAKKTPATKKTVAKTPRSKNAKVAKAPTPRAKKEVVVESTEKKVEEEANAVTTEKLDPWENVKPTMQELKVDETRSGRKRKPTEKAREHEQNSTKRLKVLKGRGAALGKRSGNDSDQSQSNDPPANDSINQSVEIVEEKLLDPQEEEPSEKRLNAAPEEVEEKSQEIRQAESAPEVVAKKILAAPGAKRKMPVGQKFSRQKLPAKKKPTLGLKSKFPKGISRKTATKMINAKTPKQRNRENSQSEAKPKKKANNEIDRLLQDEGVVNLLYDVEQTGKKRLVPITKSQTKVMDLQKIQRELKIRTKLVRNAVLRLRTSNISTSKVSPRSKRSTSYNSGESVSEKRAGSEQNKSGAGSPTDFIYPAKIRNAADASIIIRRHSSSSFSSVSASPRASIDGPDRLSFDGARNEDGGSHVLRSNKRLHSREEDDKGRGNGKKKKPQQQQQQQQSPETKRNRRKTVDEPEAKVVDLEEIIATTKSKPGGLGGDLGARGAKKFEGKKNSRFSKQLQEDPDETAGVKGATRSNGAGGGGGGKIMPKSKKSIKGKVTFAKGSESFSKTETSERDDELSACLAEVVTALANDSGGPSRGRSTVPVNRYKTKGIASSVKTSETDGTKPKLESRVQFSNKEINVQRHGNLVQLLLTPSKTTKIRNGITLQVMQEIRENLSILKKDEECRVVLLTSTGSSFCEGLELSTILHENKEERRIRAQELANGVKEFIKSLATFNKPIVAGVQGSAIGLGVTMLPWFDLVIASDKATFSTPYGKLGQIAEGAAIFTLSHILGSAVTSELLLGGRTLTASEALRAGLVTRVLWPDRFQAELLPSLRAMSEQSSQSMEATKALLRHSLRKKLDAALESESYLLVQHWCSAECQAAITAYVDEHIQ